MDQPLKNLDETHGAPPVLARPTSVNEGVPIQDVAELSQLLTQSRFSLALHRDLSQLALDGNGVSELAATLARRIDHTVLIENRFLHRLAFARPNPLAVSTEDV